MHELADAAPIAMSTACGAPTTCAELCEKCRVRLIAVCAALAEGEIGELEALAERRQLPARRSLFHQGDAVGSLYTITSGTIRLQNDLSDGRRQIMGFALPGDFLGLALESHYGFSAETLTPANVCRFDRARFVALLDRKPHLLARLHAATSHELAIAQAHMVVLGRRRAEERVAAFLMGWRERLAVVQGRSATVPLPMGRQDIADHLGLTIETVSRVFARWARDKIVLGVPNGVRVLDDSRLAALVAD